MKIMAVIGAGIMGSSIAQVLFERSYDVILHDRNP